MNDTHSSWDDDDEAIDLDLPGGGDSSVLDAFDFYAPAATAGDDGDEDSIDTTADDLNGDLRALLFTITNPPGTVSVTASFDGRIQRVELSPRVTAMTERQLADEVTVLARLARQRARAGQHALIVEFMRRLGHDRLMTRGFLEHDLGLPSPESVRHEVAQVFSTRYSSDPE